jgi:hypothetical protein
MQNSNSPTFNAVGTGVINLGNYNPNTPSFTKIGTGTLNVTGASTSTSALTVTQGTLNLSGSGAFTGTSGSVIVQNNGLLNVDDTGTATTRIGGTSRTVDLRNGNFTFVANGTAASALQFGALTSTWGGNTITLNNAGTADATLTFASMASNVVSGGSVLTLASTQAFGPATNRLIITTTPTLTNNLIPRMVVVDANGVNFATNAVAATPTASTTNGSNVVTLTTGNTFQLAVGQSVTNANIAGTITAITGPTTFTVSANATATASASLTVSASGIAALGAAAHALSDGTGTGTDLTFTNLNGGTAYGLNAARDLISGVFSTAATFRVTADTAALSNPGLNFRGINALKIEGAGTDVAFATSGGTQLGQHPLRRRFADDRQRRLGRHWFGPGRLLRHDQSSEQPRGRHGPGIYFGRRRVPRRCRRRSHRQRGLL